MTLGAILDAHKLSESAFESKELARRVLHNFINGMKCLTPALSDGSRDSYRLLPSS